MQVSRRSDNTRANRSPALRLRIVARASGIYRSLKNEKLPNILGLALLLIIGGSILVYVVEAPSNDSMFGSFADSLWWAVVTISTVGYGDRYPTTGLGRLFAMVVMLTGVVVTSVLSGTIASIFVDRKIREGRGLEEVTTRDHVVICGWNARARSIVDGLNDAATGRDQVVLVNELDPEAFQELTLQFQHLDLRFVRGDFTNENILKRASVHTAAAAIIVSDESGANTLGNADERTILAAFAVSSISDETAMSAELINPENEQHLRRANVSDILINGEFNGFLHANAARGAGIPRLVKELLTVGSPYAIQQVAVPAQLVGNTFIELTEHFLTERGATVIGLLSIERKVSLDEMLSEGSTAIDEFIKRKFAEAETTLFDQEKPELQIVLNPDPGYVLRDSDFAFVIGAIQ